MAAKKYYWLKLHKDFFKRHDIKIIESGPNGKDYILFYLKLLVESIDHDGRLRFSDTIPYDEKMLSVVTGTNVDVVRGAMEVFTELHMIDILDDKTIFMAESSKMLGCETKWAEKKREYNANKKPELNCCRRLNAETLLLPDGQKKYVDEKRYGGNGALAYDRASGKCEDCGTTENLLIHHLNGYSNQLEDLIVLCTKCHGKHHSGGHFPPIVHQASSHCPPDVRQEIEKEIEIEKESPHTPLDGGANNDDPQVDERSSRCFSPEHESAVRDWVTYKNEKRQCYKPMGLRNLLTTIKNNDDIYGEPAVIALMSECMASNWQGIMFDRLRNGKPAQPPAQKKKLSYRIEVIDGEEVAVIDR